MIFLTIAVFVRSVLYVMAMLMTVTITYVIHIVIFCANIYFTGSILELVNLKINPVIIAVSMYINTYSQHDKVELSFNFIIICYSLSLIHISEPTRPY